MDFNGTHQLVVSLNFTTFDAVMLQWVSPFMFSVVCLVLVMAITLVTKISYSRTASLTQLSMYPYYVIMVYLTLEALEIIMIIVAFNFLLELPDAHFFTNIIWPIIGTFSIAKFVTYTIFVNC